MNTSYQVYYSCNMSILYDIIKIFEREYFPIIMRDDAMFFESCKSILYSDTLVPDIFITEYMPLLSSDSVKVYLYSLF